MEKIQMTINVSAKQAIRIAEILAAENTSVNTVAGIPK